MANNNNGNQFRDDEIVFLTEDRDGKLIKSIHPKIGGRLRLAHEQNQQISITTEVIRYDENIAVVRSVTTTMKGTFPGIGMASVERDHAIAPAILELAGTRSIARSLRFAGYGVEYCSAEEISHLGNGNGGANFAREEMGKKGLAIVHFKCIIAHIGAVQGDPEIYKKSLGAGIETCRSRVPFYRAHRASTVRKNDGAQAPFRQNPPVRLP
jgi:hypothetical protein